MPTPLAVFVLVSCVCLAVPATAQSPAPDVRVLEEALVRGLIEKDRRALDRLVAAGFVRRGRPDVSRAAWLDHAVSSCWGDQVTIDEFSAVPFGHGIIATFTLTTDRDPTTCEPAVVRSLITDFWHPVDGGWRLALRHGGPGGSTVDQSTVTAEPPPPRWEMSGELSFVSTSGNTSTQTLGVGGHLTNRSGAWRSKAAVVFVRAETDDTETARTLGVDFRVVRDLTPRAGWYGHSAYQRDTFAGIEHRIGADSGLAFKVVTARSHGVDLDLGLGYTNETRIAQADRSFPAGTLAVACRWAVTETTQATNDTALTANLRQGGDWRVASVAALSTALSGTLSLRLSYQVTFMNRAVPGFRRTDTTASAAVVAKLSR